MPEKADIEGRWIHQDEDSDAEYVIEHRDDGIAVTARCISDDELMEVRNLRWEGDDLKFDTVVPSSGYHARHTLRFPEPDRCDHELTLFEIWKRVPPGETGIEETEQAACGNGEQAR